MYARLGDFDAFVAWSELPYLCTREFAERYGATFGWKGPWHYCDDDLCSYILFANLVHGDSVQG